MKVNYFRERRDHHLVITAGEYLCADYQIKMIRKNIIAGLICPGMRQVDGETEYDYLITGYQSLQTYVETVPISGQVVAILVDGLCGVLDELDRYLLDGEYLALRPEYIYLERSGEDIVGVKYCMFPFQSRSQDEQVRDLFKYMINEVDYEDDEAVKVVYELFQAASQEIVDTRELGHLVDALKRAEITAAEVEPEKDTVPEVKNRVRNSQCPTITSSEEVLWIDDSGREKVKSRWPANRKLSGKYDFALPDTGKKSILKMIIQSRR